MRLLFIGIVFSLFSAMAISAQTDSIKTESPFSYEASFTGDGISNFRGGIKKGTGFLGLTNIQLTFDTEKAKLWRGGSFHINFSNTFGDTPSGVLVGDVQGFNNIEAGNHTFLQELWFNQQIGKVNITLGLQDMNVDFAASHYGSAYINSSFGIHSTFSSNISSPIFPLTSLGLTILWDITPTLTWKNALYDGEPSDFHQNPFNINWKLSGRDGVLWMSELQKNIEINRDLPGYYRFGAFVHEHTELDTILNTDHKMWRYGLYFVGDQRLILFPNGHNLGLFTQMSYCPQKESDNYLYIGGGLSVHGMGNRMHDHYGIGVAYARLRSKAASETAIEAFYKYRINEFMYVQPDLQYILNPLGTDEKLANAFVGTLRFALNF